MAVLFTGGKFQAMNAGGIVPYGRLHSYAAGGGTAVSDERPTYADQSGLVPNANPILLNAYGQAGVWLDPALAYRMILKDAAGVTIWDVDHITVDQLSSLANSADVTKGDALVAVKPSDAGAVATTLHNWIQGQVRNLGSEFGIVSDGVTDQTAAILAKATTGVYVIPYNTLFDIKALQQGLPTDVVLIDFSVINSYRSAGETSKVISILSSDEAVSDTHLAIQSGHHAIFTLNNSGTAGSSSGNERKGSVVWAAGHHQLGAADKRGFRGGAILQFTQDTGNPFWVFTMRALAPWLALAGQHEEWTAGMAISGAGVYRNYNGNHYVSTGGGTAGATPPTHTTGTVTDGAVSWTWVDNTDRTVFGIDQFGRMLFNAGSYGDTVTHKVAITDPSGVFTYHGKATGVSKVAQLRLTPTNAGSAEVLQPYLRAEDGVGLKVMRSDSGATMAIFSDAGFTSGLGATLGAAPTIASAGTIAPTTRQFFVSGAAAIATITPPPPLSTSGGTVIAIPLGAFTFTTAGNIFATATAVVGKPMHLTYESGSGKWYSSY